MITFDKLRRMEDGLVVVIPPKIADQLNLVEGQVVRIEAMDRGFSVRRSDTIRLFSRERLIEQYQLFKEGKLERHEEIDWGDPVGNELGGPDDPTRFDKW